MDNKNYFISKCYNGLNKRGLAGKPEYKERLDNEISIIQSGSLEDFFLNTAYIILKIKSEGIMTGLGRGSAAGSLVCYCLGITEIDPIKHGLIFERFLNPTRINAIASADIDSDIPRTKRQDVLKMVKEEFGEDKTFQIINQIKWTEKTAIKDLGRIIGLDFQYINKMTRIMSDDQRAEDVPDLTVFLEKNPFIRDNYKKLVGLTKALGVHAGGVITLDNPVEQYDSIVKVNGVKCIDNDGKTTDSLGFLKNDLLGLNTLDIISDTIDLLPNVNLPKQYNDPEVFKTINKSTLGIFQLEGAGATNVCERLQPSSFEELCGVVALCRPGSMDSGDTDRYIARKHGEEEVVYDHPSLEPILEKNYGCIIYQEDAMRIVTDFAGMSNVNADTIRKGIGKKIQTIFDEYHPKFISACNSNGIDTDIAETVWEKMEASASYSFNKSHCVAYTSLSYICGWLKAYYPIEFYLAILNNTESEDKRMKVYSEIKEQKNAIENPDINMSREITVNRGGKIYLSLNLIKDVGEAAIKNILAAQPFASYEDFCNRCKVNKRVKKALIEAGAFDRFEIPRYELYNTLTGEDSVWDEKETLFREFNRIKINPNGNILDLFNLNELGIVKEISSIKDLESNTEYKDFYIKVLSSDFKLKEDYAHASVTDGFNSIGLFITKEFLQRYTNELSEIGNPLICHVHGKDGRYTLLSLISLQDIEKHSTEYKFYTGQTNETLVKLQRTNPDYNVGVASNIRFFTSKSGNRCCWYNIFVDEDIILEDRIMCNSPDIKMTDGSYIFFLMGNNEVFPQIIEVI